MQRQIEGVVEAIVGVVSDPEAAGEGVTVVDARLLAVPGAPIALSAPVRAAAR